MTLPFAVTNEQFQELFTALSVIRTKGVRYVSRTQIDQVILSDPDQYPIISQMTPRFRKYLITRYMKTRFSLWGGNGGSKPGHYVWVIGAELQAGVPV